MLDSISTFFKPEEDPFFKLGKEQGIEQGIEQGEDKKSFVVVANLIEKFGFNDKQAADAANVPVAFVKQVRKSLHK